MKKLTSNEARIEKALIKGEYKDVDKSDFELVAQSLASRKKDAVLNIRINKEDLKSIKKKAKKYGVKYQTLISEWLHHVAH